MGRQNIKEASAALTLKSTPMLTSIGRYTIAVARTFDLRTSS